MTQTLYRRPLPADAIAFSSSEGRQVFAEALAAGGMDGYFPLAEQFHTQAEPTYCGLGSLVVALNALAIDPGRLWKGPWRWFGEELLDCCVPLEEVRARGLDLDELACLARCNGAEVVLHRADTADLATWRRSLASASNGETVLVASYDRNTLGQSGSGHFSPVGGHHAARDLALILDVARFKYPPHWVSAELLWTAMHPVDSATGRARGWMDLRRRSRGIALGFCVTCAGETWQGLALRLRSVIADLGSAADIAALARGLVPLIAHVELRKPVAEVHHDALVSAQAELRALPVHTHVASAVGAEQADVATMLLLASVELLTPDQQVRVKSIIGTTDGAALAAELAHLGAQLAALRLL